MRDCGGTDEKGGRGRGLRVRKCRRVWIPLLTEYDLQPDVGRPLLGDRTIVRLSILPRLCIRRSNCLAWRATRQHVGVARGGVLELLKDIGVVAPVETAKSPGKSPQPARGGEVTRSAKERARALDWTYALARVDWVAIALLSASATAMRWSFKRRSWKVTFSLGPP